MSDASYGICRDYLRGVICYSRVHGPWKVYANIHRLGWPRLWERLPLDGVIGMWPTDEYDEHVHRLGVPAVNVSASRQSQPFASVHSDGEAVGRLAAEHLLDRGFRRFVYFSDQHRAWSLTRGRGFAHRVAEAGGRCDELKPSVVVTERGLADEVIAFIDHMQPPIGAFSGNAELAWTFIGICQDRGFDVPEQVAVVAAGDDDLVCEAADVPISAVDLGGERVGFEAAALLERMMSGEPAPPPDQPLLVPPSHVTTRRSSDILAIDDPDVAAAVRIISERATGRLTVPDILAAVPVSRRVLERRFKALMGRTVQAEITRVRLARACELLIDSDLNQEQIAHRCGFPHAAHFGKVFRAGFGQTPASYRRAMRLA